MYGEDYVEQLENKIEELTDTIIYLRREIENLKAELEWANKSYYFDNK